jgi:ABC-2 type transport system ATP-binding protein
VIIKTRQLVREYRRVIAVCGLDLVVPEGRISGFPGPNGSGKTTTIKMLLGLVRPTAGEGFVFGKPISDETASIEIRQRVGYVSAWASFIPRFCRANLFRQLWAYSHCT